ncbi:MAG: 23S rRNA (uracil(1939)-C(5))-methyltransferase RlmD [Lachnospiraceae bacterium]|nr:23S rRNA (uracil(1939)-C(5))-methyltransferase RlmD [Lachnospiraceae bacterium]
MKRGEIVTGIVGETTFPNNGSIIVDDTRVKVKGVLPGQEVEAAIKRSSKEKAEGILRRVITPSPLESAEPACPKFGICGSCTLQRMPYEEQLKLKEAHIRKLLSPVIRNADECQWLPIAGSPSAYEYRNKMEFTFGDEYRDGPITLGQHKKGSMYDLVNAECCCLIDEDVRSIVRETLRYAEESGLSFYHKMRKEGYLRHLLVRKAKITGEILVDIVTTTQQEHDWSKWASRIAALPFTGQLKGVLHTVNDAVADTIINDGTTVLYGEDCITEKLLGLTFRISAFSFFQTNSEGAEVLYSAVRDRVLEVTGESGGVIFDLYSGTGTIGQLLAQVARKVVGIEIVEEAVVAARANATLNGLTNCEFIAGDVLKKLDEVTERPDFIVLDPPREGVNPKALAKILAYGVDHMVYISCKPTSLANDLVAIQDAGYRIVSVQPVDMFPQTPHVETVALLSKLSEAKK